MQAYDREEKGLFTFYLQQADYEDILTSQKGLEKVKENMKREERVIPNQNHLVDHQMSKISQQSKRKASHNHTAVTHITHKAEEDIPQIQQTKQNSDKIVELLQKHKYIHHNKPQIKVILKPEERIDKVTSSQLKAHLLQLMVSDKSSAKQISPLGKEESKMAQKMKQTEVKNIRIQKPNPFKKLALLPTSFDNQISTVFEEKEANMLYNSRSLVHKQKKHEYQRHRHESNLEMEDKDHNYTKNIFPKIEFKSNSEVIKKLSRVIQKNSKVGQGLSARYKNPIKMEQTYLKPIQTDRYRQKRDYFLNVQALKMNSHEYENYSRYPDQAQSCMLTHNQDGKSQFRMEFSKDKAFMDIVKKLKFK